MKILAITQARIGSTRLPEKILKTINGESILEIHLKRILESKAISKLKVATTTEAGNEKIESIAQKLGVDVFKGSVNNVLERFYKAAITEKPNWVVRLTSDCPLIDAEIIDNVIDFAISKNLDYASNTLEPTFPDGMDVEIFKFTALEQAFHEAILKSELEHVTPYIWKNSSFKGDNIFTSDCYKNDSDYSSIRLTVDTQEDFLVIQKLVELYGIEKDWMTYVNGLQEHPDIRKINENFQRNEGYEKSTKEDNKN